MVTIAPPNLVSFALTSCAAIPTAKYSGIIVGCASAAEGGYHISREDQPPGNYSISHYPADAGGDRQWASAVDISMEPREMGNVTHRLTRALSAADPRASALRAFNGSLNGKTALRWECDGAVGTAAPEHAHCLHLEIFRSRANDLRALFDLMSVMVGADSSPFEECAVEQVHGHIERSLDSICARITDIANRLTLMERHEQR